ncbi:MAG: uncharacterized protein KVP18_000748 [Porospora cf. gigantea A]|uniref:uncharacterized protein n=1 Tax=Porospora cf. gigantea A TaxID=2853593 RepID=UPI00355A29E9|nr:MAG: hypothetical protein KVP18_000748 [Porospora cf. gigantea A]
MGKKRRGDELISAAKRSKENQTVADLLVDAGDSDSEINYEDFFEGEFQEPADLDVEAIDRMVEGNNYTEDWEDPEDDDADDAMLMKALNDQELHEAVTDDDTEAEESDGDDLESEVDDLQSEEENQDSEEAADGTNRQLVQQQKAVADEIERLELGLIADKHWTMRGEAYAHERPKNSLLEEDLDLPQFNRPHTAVGESLEDKLEELDDESHATTDFAQRLDERLVKVIKQRIQDGLFDDPEHKSAPDPNAAKKAEEAEIELEYQKSKLSLAEIYAKDYEHQILNTTTAAKGQEHSEEKTEITKLFSEVMFTLDNAVFDNKVKAF